MTRLRTFISVKLIVFAYAAAPAQGDVQQTSGKLTLLRVYDQVTKYGPPNDQVDVEVVIQLDGSPGKAFGFQFGPENRQAPRKGMLDLLRDAFNANRKVILDYSVEPGKKNGVIVGVLLSKEAERLQARVMELPNLLITAEDPILRGVQLDPAVLRRQFPDPPPEYREKGAHELMGKTNWSFLKQIKLDSGNRRDTTVSFDKPVLVQARATWFGALVPVEMTVVMDGAILATGRAYPSRPDRGTITVDVQIRRPGTATVSFVNKGLVPINVEMVVGVLPLAAVP